MTTPYILPRALLAAALMLPAALSGQEQGQARIRIAPGSVASPRQTPGTSLTGLFPPGQHGPVQARLILGPGSPPIQDRQVRATACFGGAPGLPGSNAPAQTAPSGIPRQNPAGQDPVDADRQRRQDEQINPFDPDNHRPPPGGVEPVESTPAPDVDRSTLPAPRTRPLLPGERGLPSSPPPVTMPDYSCPPRSGPFPESDEYPMVSDHSFRYPVQSTPLLEAPDDGIGVDDWISPEGSVPFRTGETLLETFAGTADCGQGSHPCAPGCCTPLFYFDLLAGTHALDDGSGVPVENRGGTVNMLFDSGYSLGARAGIFHGDSLRTDVEFNLRHNDLAIGRDFAADTGPVGSLPVQATGAGDWLMLSGFANVAWDFHRLRLGRLTPYTGVGAGFLTVHADMTSFTAADNRRILERDSSIALQAFAGATCAVTSRLELFGEYRILDADPFVLSTESGAWLEGTSLRSALRNDRYDVSGESVVFGLRMKF